jgi:hypothetical protein
MKTFGEFLNEATNYYSMDFARKQNKEHYDYREKVMDLAEEGMKWLEGALAEVENEPGTFDVKDFGFSFAGNASFVLVKFADVKKRAQLSARAHTDEIQDLKGFKDYFDMSVQPSIAGSTAAKEYDLAFRIKI